MIGPLARDALSWIRHREERSDVAIHGTQGDQRSLDCFAPLAMTEFWF
jgi:hypothetical protein